MPSSYKYAPISQQRIQFSPAFEGLTISRKSSKRASESVISSLQLSQSQVRPITEAPSRKLSRMNAIFLVGFVALATFSLCEGSTPSINVQGLDINTIRNVGKGQAIKIFGSPSSSNNGHLLGDMQFVDNEIVIPEPGLYFFYATLRVHGYDQRFSLTINSKDVFYGIPVGSGGTSISGTYCVKKGDKIGLKAYDNVSIWVSKTHDNLGAFKIIATETC